MRERGDPGANPGFVPETRGGAGPSPYPWPAPCRRFWSHSGPNVWGITRRYPTGAGMGSGERWHPTAPSTLEATPEGEGTWAAELAPTVPVR